MHVQCHASTVLPRLLTKLSEQELDHAFDRSLGLRMSEQLRHDVVGADHAALLQTGEILDFTADKKTRDRMWQKNIKKKRRQQMQQPSSSTDAAAGGEGGGSSLFSRRRGVVVPGTDEKEDGEI